MHTFKLYLFSFFSCCLLFACANSTKEGTPTKTEKPSKLGDIAFDVSGNSIAEPAFEKGLLLLHSFEYEDARTAFLEAQKLDSTFAMAYWGEAMSYNHSLWQRQEKDKALAALNKLAPTAEAREKLAATELQKDFFRSLAILFGEGTKYERDIAYNQFLEGLTQKYPENNEIAAFYAISLLGASRNGRDSELYDKSARIVQGIIEENPNHPGALHYLIHSYDDPVHAHLAKAAADSYAKVAPDAAHALHMPSHIYVALGRWDDVVTSNIASWNASVKRMERKELNDDARSYHAFNWLQYGFLQRGEFDEADKVLKDMVKYKEAVPNKKARGYLLAMKGAQMVETNTWDGEWAGLEVDVSDLNLSKKTGNDFLNGMVAYHQKEVQKLTAVIQKMEQRRKKAQHIVGDSGFAMCSAGGYASKPPNQLEIDMAQVMEMELQAYLASLNGDMKAAKTWFEKGIALDEKLSYSFGPPSILKPVHEAYGEWLLANNQLADALTVFDKALTRQPRRLLSLEGKKKAAEMLQKEAVVAEVRKELDVSLAEKERGQIL